MKSKEIVVKQNIPTDIERDSILDIHTTNSSYATHGFHKYPAKFIPHIPKWALEKYAPIDKKSIILDPFCGSGTTLVESLLCGYNFIGVDIDPLSSLISKVKTTPIKSEVLEEVIDWLLDSLEKEQDTIFMPETPNLSHWFTEEAIAKLGKIRSLIDTVKINFSHLKNIGDIYDFLIICFSSIIRRVSNADNESQKTYVSHTKIKVPEEVYSTFLRQLAYFKTRIESISQKEMKKVKGRIINTSSTNLYKAVKKYDIELAITSPPYIKTIDYIYNQLVELFWIGDLFDMQTQKKQNSFKYNYVGNKQFRKETYHDYSPHDHTTGLTELDRILTHIFETDNKNGLKHAYVTDKYFSDMSQHFHEMSLVLSKGKKYVMVIGDSNISQTYIPTSDILTSIAERHGFELTNRWGYKIKNRFMRFDRKGRGGIIDIDWVLEFEKK